MEKFKILSYIEENQLTLNEKIEYYENLKKYLKNQPLKIDEIKNLTFCSWLNKYPIRQIVNKIKKYDLEVRGIENIPSCPVIYASIHQDYNDHFNCILTIPEHSIILNTSTVTKLFKLIMGFNGIVYVNRESKESRFNSKLKLMKYLSLGKSIIVFPEGTYNCSPNKLHLPLHSGVLDMARKMQVPIVPMVQEYIYYDGGITTKDKVQKCIVCFGPPIYLSASDSFEDKKQELSESFSTIRYNLIEEKGLFQRQAISNEEYINYVLGRIDTWKKIKVDINDERKTIYGYNDDFYLFHHINDVRFDDKGNLLPTEFVSNLEKIYTWNKRY